MSYRAYPDYRPSGIDGLGELPATWNARRLRFLVHGIDQGWSPRASNVPAEGDELGVLKLSAVSGGHFDSSENKQLDEVPEGQVILTPRRHDLLMTRANTPLLVGDVCVVLEDHPNLIIPDLIYRLRVDRQFACERYVSYFLLSRAGRGQIEAQARGSSASMVKLGQGHLQDFQIPLPALLEQTCIADFLDWKIKQISDLILKKRDFIYKLKEQYFTTISIGVTRGLNPDAPMRDSEVSWIGLIPKHWEVKKLSRVHCRPVP